MFPPIKDTYKYVLKYGWAVFYEQGRIVCKPNPNSNMPDELSCFSFMLRWPGK